MPDWVETTLDSCVALTKGVTYAAADYADKWQGHPFLTIKSVKKGGGFNEEGLKYYKGPYKPGQVVKPGDLLIALTDLTRAGDIIGGPFRVPELGESIILPSMDLAVLREGEDPIEFSFLSYRLMLHDARRYMLARSAGTTVLHLDSKAALTFSFLRPEPEAQKRITEILSTVDTAIEQTEDLIAKTQHIKAGLMHDLFTRGVTTDGQLRPPRENAPQLYKESSYGWIPKGWDLKPCSEICLSVIDCKNRTPPTTNNGHPVIRTPNVRNGEFVWTDLAHTDSASYIEWTKRGRPVPGDVVITREAPVGEVCIIPDDLEAPCLGQRMMLYRPDPNLVSSSFLLHALQSPRVQKYLDVISGGSTVGHVRVGDIRGLLVPWTAPEEQEVIAVTLDSVRRQLASLATEAVKLKQLKAGLMNDLLDRRASVVDGTALETTEIVPNV